jgi:hypothetical protein
MKTGLRSLFGKVGILFLAAAGGCAHNLELCNAHRYRNSERADFSKRGLLAFVVSETLDVSSQMFCRQVGIQMAQQGGYAVTSSPDADTKKADVDVRISVETEASGRLENFLISWPGFLLFAHAWLGYGYDVRYKVRCVVTNSATTERIADFTELLHLELRHSEFDRTWAAGCGWLFLYSATAFVNGFYVTSYDRDITPLLYSAAYPMLARRVALRLVKEINTSSIETANTGNRSEATAATGGRQSYCVEMFERVSGDDFAYRYRLRLRDGADAGLSAMNRIKEELRASVAADYAGAHGGRRADVQVDFPVFALKGGVVEGRAEVMRIDVMSLNYDPRAQKGTMAVKIGSKRFEDARAWVRKNIETLARDKNIVLTTGEIPAAARFYLRGERVKDGSVLEIEFETE